MVISVGQGEYPIPPLEVLKTILGLNSQPELSLHCQHAAPRTIVAYLVGGDWPSPVPSCKDSHAIPLADPDIIGINAGASLAAVTLFCACTVGTLIRSHHAFGGAMVIAPLIYLLAWDREVPHPILLASALLS